MKDCCKESRQPQTYTCPVCGTKTYVLTADPGQLKAETKDA